MLGRFLNVNEMKTKILFQITWATIEHREHNKCWKLRNVMIQKLYTIKSYFELKSNQKCILALHCTS